MKNCQYCSAEIHDEAVLCVHCGRPLAPMPNSQIEKDTKTCTNCGNECHKDAVICIKCGQGFTLTNAQPVNPTATSEQALQKPKKAVNKARIVFSILSAISFVLFPLVAIVSVINGFDYFEDPHYIVRLISMVGYIMTELGLIIYIGKKNPLPSIGLMLVSMVSIADWYFIGYNGFNIGTEIVLALCFALASVLFVIPPKISSKIWFIPFVLGIIYSIIEYGFDIYIIFEIFDSWELVYILNFLFMGLVVRSNKYENLLEE